MIQKITQGMRVFGWLILAVTIAGCSGPLPVQEPGLPISSPALGTPRPEEIRKLGPDLRRHLLQRGRRALEAPESISRELQPIPVVIQARRDITEDLENYGVRVRSVIRNGVVVITAEVPPAAIPSLLTLPDLETIELTRPVPPAREDSNEQ